MADRREVKTAERSFRQNLLNSYFWREVIIFALLASLRSDIFSEIDVDNLLVDADTIFSGDISDFRIKHQTKKFFWNFVLKFECC